MKDENSEKLNKTDKEGESSFKFAVILVVLLLLGLVAIILKAIGLF